MSRGIQHRRNRPYPHANAYASALFEHFFVRVDVGMSVEPDQGPNSSLTLAVIQARASHQLGTVATRVSSLSSKQRRDRDLCGYQAPVGRQDPSNSPMLFCSEGLPISLHGLLFCSRLGTSPSAAHAAYVGILGPHSRGITKRHGGVCLHSGGTPHPGMAGY